MSVALLGIPDDDPNDRFITVAPSIDEPVIEGPLSKDRREDLQILNFLLGVASKGARHPLGVRPGADPPDRIVSHGATEWAVELTELTVEDVRLDLARARMVGRQLRRALDADPARFVHLQGRRVALSIDPQATLQKNLENEIDELCALLAEDKGCFGDDVDMSAGFYGSSSSFVAQVYSDGTPGAFLVNSSSQGTFLRSEAIAGLQKRVAAKDKPQNEMLLITFGLPDEWGIVCAFDQHVWAVLVDFLMAGGQIPLSPTHLEGVVIHQWPHGNWLAVYQRNTADLPWKL